MHLRDSRPTRFQILVAGGRMKRGRIVMGGLKMCIDLLKLMG